MTAPGRALAWWPLLFTVCVVGCSNLPAELVAWTPSPLTHEPVAFRFVYREPGLWARTDEREQARLAMATALRLFPDLEIVDRNDGPRPLEVWRTDGDAPIRVRLTLSVPQRDDFPFTYWVQARVEVYAYGEQAQEVASVSSGSSGEPVDTCVQLALYKLSQHPGWARRWKAPASADSDAAAGQRD